MPIPSMEELKAEEDEIAPYLIFTIKDSKGDIVRKLSAGASKGTSCITWDLRYADKNEVYLKDNKFDPNSAGGSGILAMPGKYTVSISQVFHETEKELAGPVEFTIKVLNNTTLPATDRGELVAFQDKVSLLVDAVNGAEKFANELMERTQYVKQTIQNTPGAPFTLMGEADKVEKQLHAILWSLNGQPAKASDEENWPAPPPVKLRLGAILEASYGNTSTPTQTQRDQYALLEVEFPPILDQLREIAEKDLKTLEDELVKLGAPWTPGHIPEWKK
jgi:hypothetical protein